MWDVWDVQKKKKKKVPTNKHLIFGFYFFSFLLLTSLESNHIHKHKLGVCSYADES